VGESHKHRHIADECLNAHWFTSVAHAEVVIETSVPPLTTGAFRLHCTRNAMSAAE
jgi:hypothetical protein